jgi:hypothetical protein
MPSEISFFPARQAFLPLMALFLLNPLATAFSHDRQPREERP